MIEHHRNLWDRLHREGYKGYSFNAKAEHILRQLPPNWLRPDMTALEIGAGEGHYMKEMAPFVKTVHGIDISKEATARAENYLKDTPNAYVQVCDGESIPYPSGRFDFIYSVALFHHLPRVVTESYLEEARRVLVPNGMMLFQLITFRDPKLNEGDIGLPEREETLGWGEGQVREMLRRVDLEVVSVVDDHRLCGGRADLSHLWVTCRKKRQLIVSIDADGCWSIEWCEKILYLIKKYPQIKFTVGIIVAYFDGSLLSEQLGERTRLMKEIFAQPNVEPASHSWSHPMDWGDHDSPNLMGGRWEDSREITYSTDFVEDDVTDKKVKVFLLTGDSNPTPEALKMIYDRGLIPFNAYVDRVAPYENVGGYLQWAQRAYPDVHYTGIRKYRDEGGKQVNYVDNPEGYRKVLDYFEEHPERPVHVYVHFYCAEFPQTYGSVDYVLGWATKQSLEPLFISEYVERIRQSQP